MMEDIQAGSVFGIVPEMEKIDALDLLSVSVYILRGVSDSLLALSEQSHDYQDVMRMLSDVVTYESLAIEKAEKTLENTLAHTLVANDADC